MSVVGRQTSSEICKQAMRGDEFPPEGLPLNFDFDDFLLFENSVPASGINQAKPDKPPESSTQSTAQSVPAVVFAPFTSLVSFGDAAWHCHTPLNGLSTPSHSQDFDFLTSDLSLSPLRVTHPHTRSRSTSPDVGVPPQTASRRGSWILEEPQLTDGGCTDGTGTDGNGTATSEKIPRHRRPAHKRAEAKRRNKIQEGLERLTGMVPRNVESSGGIGKCKKSKAAVLRKSADYCRRLMTECNAKLAEGDALRAEMQALTADIKHLQDVLPAEGMVPMAPGSSIPIEQMFSNYVQTQSLSKWKFWIFGRLTRPLFESFNRVVSVSSIDAFRQSSVHWMRDYLSLVALRPVLLAQLRELVTSTSIMTNPERLETEVRSAIRQEAGLISSSMATMTATTSTAGSTADVLCHRR